MDTAQPNAPSGADQLRRVLRIVRRLAWYPGTILGITAVIVSLFMARYFMGEKLYESETVILVQSQNLPEEYIKSTVTFNPEKYVNTLSRQVMSRSRLESIIQDHNLYEELRRRATMDEVVEKMQGRITVQVYSKESFKITYAGNDPKVARAVCARLARMFIDENVNERSRQARTNADFLASQAEEARLKLQKSDEAIRAFKETHLGSLPSEIDSNSQSLDQLTSRLNTISEDIRSARTRKTLLQPQLIEVVAQDDPSEPLRRQLNAKRQELSRAMLQFEESHPSVLSLQSEVTQLEARLAQAPRPASGVTRTNPQIEAQLKVIDQEIASLQGESAQIKHQIQELQKRQDLAPRVEMELTSMERERKILQDAYTDLLRKTEEAERARSLEDQNQGTQFKVLDEANLPERPAGAGLLKLGVFGLVLGMGLGVGLALLRVLMDNRIHEPEDVASYIDAELLVSIPRFDPRAIPKARPAELPPPSASDA